MPDRSEIEAEIARQRAALRQDLAALNLNNQPRRLVTEATDMLSASGVTQAAKAAGQAKLPLAVTGAGLTWLVGSILSKPKTAAYDHRPHEQAPSFRDDPLAGPTFKDRVAAAERASRQMELENGEVDMTYHPMNDANAQSNSTAAALRAKLEEGLEHLPEGAQQRVRQAREAAISAQAQIEAQARETMLKAKSTAYDNPLLIGALVFAAGAALAAALPRTRSEDRMLGHHRDRLFDEARRVLAEEKAKLQQAAGEAVDQATADIKEDIRNVGKPSDDPMTPPKAA